MPARSVLRGCPSELELQLLHSAGALVLDIERDVRGDAKSFVGHLDVERSTRFQSIRKPAELGHELRTGIGALEVSIATNRHGSPSSG